MENAIARKLDPPVINPVEIESRRKAEGHFSTMAKELAFLGIQAAPPEAVLVSREYLASVETLADIGLKAGRARPGPLGWD